MPNNLTPAQLRVLDARDRGRSQAFWDTLLGRTAAPAPQATRFDQFTVNRGVPSVTGAPAAAARPVSAPQAVAPTPVQTRSVVAPGLGAPAPHVTPRARAMTERVNQMAQQHGGAAAKNYSWDDYAAERSAAQAAGDAAGDVDTRFKRSLDGGLNPMSDPSRPEYWQRSDIITWENASEGNKALARKLRAKYGLQDGGAMGTQLSDQAQAASLESYRGGVAPIVKPETVDLGELSGTMSPSAQNLAINSFRSEFPDLTDPTALSADSLRAAADSYGNGIPAFAQPFGSAEEKRAGNIGGSSALRTANIAQALKGESVSLPDDLLKRYMDLAKGYQFR